MVSTGGIRTCVHPHVSRPLHCSTLKTLMVGHGGSSAGSYLTDPTSPISSHCAVIILFKSVPVHQLSWLALVRERVKTVFCVLRMPLSSSTNQSLSSSDTQLAFLLALTDNQISNGDKLFCLQQENRSREDEKDCVLQVLCRDFLPLPRRLCFLIALVCLFVCLFVCHRHFSKRYEWILMRFTGELGNDTRNIWLNFGGDPNHHADCPIGNLVFTQQIVSGFFKDSPGMMQGTIV